MTPGDEEEDLNLQHGMAFTWERFLWLSFYNSDFVCELLPVYFLKAWLPLLFSYSYLVLTQVVPLHWHCLYSHTYCSL